MTRRKNIKATKHYLQERKRNEHIEKKNPHINFEREGKKTNARKWATEVTCIECGKRFTLPFKPRKPEVYCDDCFKKKKNNKKSSKEAMKQKIDPNKVKSFKEYASKTNGLNKTRKENRRKTKN